MIRLAWVVLVSGVVLARADVVARQTAGAARFAGRPLADVLRELQAQGLKIVFSSELVRPDMRVTAEPRGGTPRRILDEVLAANGLEARSGPGGTLLVVRSRRLRPRSAGEIAARGAISGTVVSARSGEPLEGVLVTAPLIEAEDRRTLTAKDGTFTLADVAAQPQPLFVSLVGYALARPIVDVQPGQTTQVTVALADGTGTYAEHVTVTADPFRATEASGVTPLLLTSAELNALRGVLTDDPFRAVQALPGVANSDDRRSEFSVRGSDFRHIGLSIDGLAARSLLHHVRDYENNGSIGLVNGDLLDRVELAAGAYAQVQPGRTGAWLHLGVREGSRDISQVHGAVSMTNASVSAEGPIGPVGNEKRGSWLVGVRQSYIQWLIKKLDFTDTAFGFTDAESKIVFDVTPRQQLQVTLLGGRSRLDQNEPNAGAGSLRAGVAQAGLAALAWRSTVGASTVVTQRFGVQGDRFRNDSVAGRTLDSNGSEISYQADAIWNRGAGLALQAGTLLQRQQQDDQFIRFLQTRTGSARQVERVDGAAWISSGTARVVWTASNGGSIDGGARLSRSTLVDETTLSPWAVANWPVTSTLSVRGGVSLAHQVPDFDQVVGTFGTFSTGQARTERSRNVDLGLELRLAPATRAQVTVYDRRETKVLRFQDSETRLIDGRLVYAGSLTPFWQPALSGTSRGFEVSVQRRAGSGLTGWLGYAYGRTRYTDAVRGETFAADFDQRHAVNAYVQARLSTKTSLNTRWRLGSGFPLAGYFEERPNGMFVGAQRNTVRLPAYSRIDVRADHTFNYRSRRLTLFAEVMNVLNRTNYAPSRRGTHDDAAFVLASGEVRDFQDTLFPLLPSIGIRIEF